MLEQADIGLIRLFLDTQMHQTQRRLVNIGVSSYKKILDFENMVLVFIKF